MSSPPSSSDPLFGLNPEHLLAMAAQTASQTDPLHLTHQNLPSLQEVAAAFPELAVTELVGHGGMSAVFRAQQPQLQRIVALKVLPKCLAATPGFAERFTREGRVLALLSHPHIVAVHDFGERNGFWYLIMEYVDGVNLRQAMEAGRFTPEQALSLIPALCDALQFAHNRGVLHRDIKPENILLDAQGRIKIADFGIAKILGEDLEGSMLLTQSGAKLGTAPYMAPEQIEKPASVDHRADIYSLGVVFYEMLTGELPLGRFAPPSELAGVGGNLDTVVFRALEKERTRRQQSAEEFKTQVANVSHSYPPPTPKRLPSTVPALLSVTVIASLLVLALVKSTETANAHHLIAVVVTAAGLVLLTAAIPLWLRRVPMDAFYGLRLPSTTAHAERWYDANAFAGRKLSAWSLPILGAGLAGFYQLPRHQDHYPWAVLALTLTCFIAVALSIASWLRHHPLNGPATKPPHWARFLGQLATATIIALFIKNFILETYRIASPDTGLKSGSHWIASRLDTGFTANDLIIFEHQNRTPWSARVLKREDQGLLLKRADTNEPFFLTWDKIIGKLLFPHFTPAAVIAAGKTTDSPPPPSPPIEGSSKAPQTEPTLKFVQIRRENENWQQPYTPDGQPFTAPSSTKFPWFTLGSYHDDPSLKHLIVLRIVFEHPDLDQLSNLSVSVLDQHNEPIKQQWSSTGIFSAPSIHAVSIGLIQPDSLPKVAQFKLSYSIGPFTNLTIIKPSPNGTTFFGNQFTTRAIGDNTENEAFLTWTGPQERNQRLDAIARLKNGQRIRSKSRSASSDINDENIFTSHTFPVPLHEIKAFEIRSRPIKTVEYRHVGIPPLQ
jgi:serine/threonine protein kinase